MCREEVSSLGEKSRQQNVVLRPWFVAGMEENTIEIGVKRGLLLIIAAGKSFETPRDTAVVFHAHLHTLRSTKENAGISSSHTTFKRESYSELRQFPTSLGEGEPIVHT